jgi:hypothetical protein
VDPIPVETLIENNGRLYDGKDRDTRRRLSLQELRELPLLDDEGNEIPLYDSRGTQIPRRSVVQNLSQPPCGVLVNLKSIQGLFNPDNLAVITEESVSTSSEYEDPFVRVEAYPLAFLKMAGNIKASGVPHCFYPLLTKINKSVRKNHEPGQPSSSNRQGGEDPGEVDPQAPYLDSTYRAVKPVCSQFYNYMTHRVASRAGRHDAQQGSVTAAISGAYAKNERDEKVAKEKQKYCKKALPSDRFHARITSVRECPNACRAELVYSVDVRALKDCSGSYVFPPPLFIARSLSLSMSAEC